MESAEHSLHGGGRALRYTVAGVGEPVLLLHGIGRSLEDWALVRDRLASGNTVYSLDLPGFGCSGRLATRTDLAPLARAVDSFLTEIGESRRIRLVGNSLGGAVALQFLSLYPERVSALVLVDSAGFGREVTPALRAIALPGVGRRLLRPSRASALRETQGIFYDQSQVTAERVDLAFALARRPNGVDVMLETVHSLGTWRGIRPAWRRHLLASVTNRRAQARRGIPLYLLWGEKDRVLPATQLDEARREFPDAQFHLFPQTGHMPQLERPDEFAELVGTFLNGVPA